jgi:hypothetical protein
MATKATPQSTTQATSRPPSSEVDISRWQHQQRRSDGGQEQSGQATRAVKSAAGAADALDHCLGANDAGVGCGGVNVYETGHDAFLLKNERPEPMR